MASWNHLESETLYNVANWGRGFFRINSRGNVEVAPDGADSKQTLDAYELLRQVLRRGIRAPILMRFDGILRSRVRQLNEAFAAARKEYDYEAPYRTVFPIKVNQERHVVEAMLEEGRRWGMGLEVGSKPELLAVITLQAGEGTLVVCNGYKDTEYIELALLATKLGITPIIVIEKMSELVEVLDASERLEIEPVIGVRSKLSNRGSGRWQDSGGDRSKFGLTTQEIVNVVEVLREKGKLNCLGMLHFHLGSQITNIRALKNGLREAARMFVGLHEMGANIRWFDVGGGLGVDYDGSSSNFESSMNYNETEYAADVVAHIADACKEAGIAQPTIISESGRALAAHHAVLITEVLGATHSVSPLPPQAAREDEPDVVRALWEVCENITSKNFQEAYHDAGELRDEGILLFNVGQLTMPERARVDEFYWRCCSKIARIIERLDYVPDDLDNLERDLASTYFLNFSLFQSLPDSWAIQQLFPVIPLHRLNEKPTLRATLADITCDSDGKVDRFIDLRDVKRTLPLHPIEPGEPYYMAFFLIGAYQEILGDMHNLFGDTNVVHVDIDETGKPRLKHVARGDRVKEVLSYVDYHEDELLRDLRKHLELALDEGRIEYEESALIWQRYEDGLRGYTYLMSGQAPEDKAPRASAEATPALESSALDA